MLIYHYEIFHQFHTDKTLQSCQTFVQIWTYPGYANTNPMQLIYQLDSG